MASTKQDNKTNDEKKKRRISSPRPGVVNENVKEIGKDGSNTLWSLGTVGSQRWVQLKHRIQGIAMSMPPARYESSTIVSLDAFLLELSKDQLQPVVIIGSSSASYAKMLQKEVKQSGALDMSDFKFNIKIGKRGQTWFMNGDKPGKTESKAPPRNYFGQIWDSLGQLCGTGRKESSDAERGATIAG